MLYRVVSLFRYLPRKAFPWNSRGTSMPRSKQGRRRKEKRRNGETEKRRNWVLRHWYFIFSSPDFLISLSPFLFVTLLSLFQGICNLSFDIIILFSYLPNFLTSKLPFFTVLAYKSHPCTLVILRL